MKYFKIVISNSNTSEEFLFTFEVVIPLTNIFLSGTDVILDTSPDSSENTFLPSARPVSEIISKNKTTGPNVQASVLSGKLTYCSESLTNSSVTAQRPPLSPVPRALAITPAINPSITPRSTISRIHLT